MCVLYYLVTTKLIYLPELGAIILQYSIIAGSQDMSQRPTLPQLVGHIPQPLDGLSSFLGKDRQLGVSIAQTERVEDRKRRKRVDLLTCRESGRRYSSGMPDEGS